MSGTSDNGSFGLVSFFRTPPAPPGVGPLDWADAIDQDFFFRNPGEPSYWRLAVVGEFLTGQPPQCGCGHDHVVVVEVTQLAPGLRHRRAVYIQDLGDVA